MNTLCQNVNSENPERFELIQIYIILRLVHAYNLTSMLLLKVSRQFTQFSSSFPLTKSQYKSVFNFFLRLL